MRALRPLSSGRPVRMRLSGLANTILRPFRTVDSDRRAWASRARGEPPAGSGDHLVTGDLAQRDLPSAAHSARSGRAKRTRTLIAAGVRGRLRSVTLLPLCRTSNSLGHARIGVVAGSRRHLYSRARVDGFRAVAEAAAASEAVISVAHGNWDREKAEAVTHSLFDADPAITAVFACSDTMALGVYDALAARALRIPADVSVVGFDDRPEAQWARPSLTTVRQPTAEMGATAVKRLLEIARTDRNGLKSPPRLEVSAELVIRESTSQAPKYQRPPAKDQLGPAAW